MSLRAAAGGGVSSSDPFYAALLPRYNAAVAKSLAGVSRGAIAFVGDSTTAGFGSGNADGTNLYARSYPVALAGRTLSSDIGSRWGPAGVVSGQDVTTLDPRVTWGSGWASTGGPFSLGGGAFFNNSTTSALNLAPVAPFDTIDVWYIRNTGLDTFTVSVDGGASVGTQSTAGAAGFAKATFTVSSGTHIVNIARTAVGASLFIVGIDTYVASARKMAFFNMGSCGSTTTQWVDASTPYAPSNALKTVAPSLAIIDLGINDMRTGVPVATAIANIQSLVTAWKPTIDIVLKIPLASDTAVIPAQTQADFRAAMFALGQSNNVPVIDLPGIMGLWATTNALGVMNDALHANAAGYQWVASLLLPIVGGH